MTTYAVVDSGTTTTRLRLWRDGSVAWSGSRTAGAKDTAVDGDTGKVEAALASLLGESGAAPSAIVCSGMITSNMGLFELPHLPAPAGLNDLAKGIVQRDFSSFSSIPLTFIPGVKTPVGDAGSSSVASGTELPSAAADLAGLTSGDVLRGEEAEIAGLHEHLGMDRDAVYLHLGSHHKAIEVDADGRILASRTAVTGELLAVVSGHTILKSSVVELGLRQPGNANSEALDLDLGAALAGAAAAEEHGVGRALFLVRVGEQLAGESKARMTSYLLGVMASLDLPLLAAASKETPVVLYGGGHFMGILAALLANNGHEVRVVEPHVADEAAARGAVRIYERARELGVVT